MRELLTNELNAISGGNGHSNYEGNSSSKSKKSGGAYSGVDSCGAGIFGGLIAGSAGGVPGMTIGVIGGMIGGQCTKDSFSSGNGGGGGKTNSTNYGAQCTW